MKIDVIQTPLTLTVFGYVGVAINKDYVAKAFQLMDSMWKTVKENNLANKGQNIWIYEPGDRVFVGVELMETPPANLNLEQKDIRLERYAKFKHVGSYQKIRQVCADMRAYLQQQGYVLTSPYLEIYGHWTPDESKLETDLLIAIK